MKSSANWDPAFLPLLLQIAFIILVGLAVKSLFKLKRIYETKSLVLIGICALAATMSFIYMPCGPTKGRLLIAQANTRSGIEMHLLQTRNNTISKPYTISFYYKNGNDKPWRWFYIDREDFYWWSGAIKIDEDNKQATIFRGSKALACFDWEQKTLTFFNSRGITNGPQKITPYSE